MRNAVRLSPDAFPGDGRVAYNVGNIPNLRTWRADACSSSIRAIIAG